jgi:hypothetical protein
MSGFKEQRHFTRIPFDARVHITEANELVCEAALLDISLKGVLITEPHGWQTEIGRPCRLQLTLADSPDAPVLTMEARVAHMENGHIGFHCEHMDIETATHLHRLVELNLGDEQLLQRELSELIGEGKD